MEQRTDHQTSRLGTWRGAVNSIQESMVQVSHFNAQLILILVKLGSICLPSEYGSLIVYISFLIVPSEIVFNVKTLSLLISPQNIGHIGYF